MAYAINHRCTSCEACVGICPTESVFAGKSRFAIDTDSCEDCRICVMVCPEDAIHLLVEVPEPGGAAAAAKKK